MSSGRSRTGQRRSADCVLAELVAGLQALLPEGRSTRRSDNRVEHEASASAILQEVCNYIRSLHREVDDLSGRLAEMLASAAAAESDSARAETLRRLLVQYLAE